MGNKSFRSALYPLYKWTRGRKPGTDLHANTRLHRPTQDSGSDIIKTIGVPKNECCRNIRNTFLKYFNSKPVCVFEGKKCLFKGKTQLLDGLWSGYKHGLRLIEGDNIHELVWPPPLQSALSSSLNPFLVCYLFPELKGLQHFTNWSLSLFFPTQVGREPPLTLMPG